MFSVKTKLLSNLSLCVCQRGKNESKKKIEAHWATSSKDQTSFCKSTRISRLINS